MFKYKSSFLNKVLIFNFNFLTRIEEKSDLFGSYKAFGKILVSK